MLCPLCENPHNVFFLQDRRRVYWRCQQCLLVFVPAFWHLDSGAEKAEYDLHRNDPEDTGYRCFLLRLSVPLCERLPVAARGLDFGSGPGPTLAPMLVESGFRMALYDPCYAPDSSVLEECYDFITCSEVVEHFRLPGREFCRLWSLLVPGGWLGIMTKLVIDRQAFARWHYKNDPTHVAFFCRDTFGFLAKTLNAHLEIIEPDVILLQKAL